MIKKLHQKFFASQFARYYLIMLLMLVSTLSVLGRELFSEIYYFDSDFYNKFLGLSFLGVIFISLAAHLNFKADPDDDTAYYRDNAKIFDWYLKFFGAANLCALYITLFYLSFFFVAMEIWADWAFWGLVASGPFFGWYFYTFSAVFYYYDSSART